MIKKFSELSNSAKPNENTERNIMPSTEGDRPGNPNLPNRKTRIEQTASTDYLMPNAQDKGEVTQDTQDSQENELNEAKDVKFYGKVAKLPKGTKASKGFNFLENIKVSKSSIWYIMVEKQSDQLQMVKYNYKKGVDLSRFVNELKTYYKSKYNNNTNAIKLIENIQIDGNDKYSWVKNIPLIEIDGKKMITKITEDLIKLLSK